MKKRNNRFSAKAKPFFDNNIYVCLAFICSAVIMMLVYYTNEVIPFGEKTVLRMDLFHQYGPLFGELYDRLLGVKSFLYSWNTGGGNTFLGNYFNYLSSPVGNIITLLSGHKNVPEAIGAMVLIKNGLSASIFSYYLKKKFKRNDFTISAFGILYAFSGFFIAYYWNIMWIDAMYLLPLIILGIEKIINFNKPLLYLFSLSYSFFANYYMSYMICIFSILYFLVYFISNFSFNNTFPIKNETKQQKILNNRFLKSGITFTLSSLLAVCLVAFALIPTYFCLKTCSATSGTFPEEIKYYNDIFDFLSNHLADLDPTIRSSGDTVIPNVYCGVINLILIPVYIFSDRISGKKKAMYITLLAVFFVCFNINFANYIIHAFHFPNDLPFRFSYIYSFFLLSMSYEALTHIKETSIKTITAAGTGAVLFIVLAQKLKTDNICDETIYISLIFVVLFTVILSVMRKKEYAASAVALLLMCSVFAEASVSDIQNFNITQLKPNFVRDYSNFREAKNYLDKKENNGFYRMELFRLGNAMIMLPSWYNYNGISVFSSMSYEKSANLQKQLGLDSNYINSYIYNSQTPIYNSMMSIKYLVSYNGDAPEINDEIYSSVATYGNFKVYENKYYLPLAFSVSEDVLDWDITGNNPFEIQNDFINYSTDISNVLKEISCSSYTCDNISKSDDYLNNSFTCYKINSDSDAVLKLNFDIISNENTYLYFDSYEIKKINIIINDSETTEQNTDDPYVFDCGKLNKGDTLTVEIPVDGEDDSFSANCFVYSLDNEKMDACYEILKSSSLVVTEFDDDDIKGTININSDKMIYTSINFDNGWKVFIDGKEADKLKIADALIGVKCPAGQHSVEFRYVPEGLFTGVLISVTSLIILILIIVLKIIINRKKNHRKNNPGPSGDNSEASEEPKGIDKMIQQDLGENVSVEAAEALLEEKDKYENQIENNHIELTKVDEMLNTQKLNIQEILNQLNDNESEE